MRNLVMRIMSLEEEMLTGMAIIEITTIVTIITIHIIITKGKFEIEIEDLLTGKNVNFGCCYETKVQ